MRCTRDWSEGHWSTCDTTGKTDTHSLLVRGTLVMHVDALDCLEIGSRGFRICLNHLVSRARLSTRGNVSRWEG